MSQTRLFLLMTVVSFVFACSPKGSVKNQSADVTPKEPPQAEAKILKDDIKKGLSSLKGKKIAAYVIFNLPDGYLIRAKAQINPPDFAIREVLDLQNERINWFNESLVVNCDGCPEVEATPPLQVLSEQDLLHFIDQVSLGRDPNRGDWKILAKEFPKADYIWLIFASEDYEQKRGPATEKNKVFARSESEVRVRSYLYEKASGHVKHVAQVRAWDVNETLFPLQAKDRDVPSSNFDNIQYDGVYPYPLVPEVPPIAQKALLRLTEALNP